LRLLFAKPVDDECVHCFRLRDLSLFRMSVNAPASSCDPRIAMSWQYLEPFGRRFWQLFNLTPGPHIAQRGYTRRRTTGVRSLSGQTYGRGCAYALCSWVFNDFRRASRANLLCGEWVSGIEDGGAFMPSALQPGYPLRTRRTFRQDGLDQRFAQKLDAGVALIVVHDSVFYISRRINHSERRQKFAVASLRPAKRHVSRACRRPHQRPQTWPLI
jgi:hypothetical protein